ncbi:MAG: FtsX-like permease family protein [Acidobacteriota bacterium]|nr:FtsX-like permease family protein [Acidobacteriota bacterium]
MIKFLFKGLIRDRSRSLFPVLTVMFGVMLTVWLYSWIKGAENMFIESSAKFSTGHVKIMSRAYAEDASQIPNDLALIGIEELLKNIKKDFQELIWAPRIRFAGLIDVPDEYGETRAQGPVAGLAIDLFSPGSPEKEIINLEKSIIRGRLPEKPGEILISDEFAQKLSLEPGEIATLISSTMYGSMAVKNFTVAGTVRFGITAMDSGTIVADISDIQNALDMEDASGEILGFFKDFMYRNEKADEIKTAFNLHYSDEEDEFLPVMDTLYNQNGLADIMAMTESFSGVVVGIFIVAMSIVLWNAGLMGNIRRYGEIGVCLAMGEDKGHIYRSIIAESLIIGCIGSFLGTALGLAISYYLQVKGINIGSLMKDASFMFTEVMRAKVTPVSFVIGFFPGILATLFGASISGIGIYKRKTSQLIRELEA